MYILSLLFSVKGNMFLSKTDPFTQQRSISMAGIVLLRCVCILSVVVVLFGSIVTTAAKPIGKLLLSQISATCYSLPSFSHALDTGPENVYQAPMWTK